MAELSNELPKDLLCAKEAAAVLGVSNVILAQWRKSGTGPRYIQYKRKGQVLYSRAVIEDFLRKHMVNPEND